MNTRYHYNHYDDDDIDDDGDDDDKTWEISPFHMWVPGGVNEGRIQGITFCSNTGHEWSTLPSYGL